MKKTKYKKLISVCALSLMMLTNTVVIANAAQPSTLTKEQQQAAIDTYKNTVIIDGGLKDKTAAAAAAAAAQPSKAPKQSAASTVTAATVKYASTSKYRGSFMLWSESDVTFGYDGTNVTQAQISQNGGSVFPMFLQKNGTTEFKYSNAHWKESSQYYGGGGVNTAWGTLGAGTTVNDVCHVYYNGGYGWE